MNRQFTNRKLISDKLIRLIKAKLKDFELKGFSSFYLLSSLFVILTSLLAFSFSKKYTSPTDTDHIYTNIATIAPPPPDCPDQPINCTFSFTGSCGGTTTVESGDTLCILSGTFDCEVELEGGTIYVAAGATFDPDQPDTFEGTIINCGTIILSNLEFEVGTDIQNYGTIEFREADQVGAANFYNYEGASMEFQRRFRLENGTTFTNDGTLTFQHNVNLRAGVFTNNDEIIALDNFTVENGATLNNIGRINAVAITIEGGSSFYNACSMIASDQITIGADVLNDGLFLVDGAPGLMYIEPGVNFTNNHEVVAIEFTNDGIILGNGNFWIDDFTIQSSGASIGTDANALNFYDRSPDQNGNGNLYFDDEDGTIDPSVTTNPPASPSDIPDQTYLGPSCSAIVTAEDCTNGIDDDGDLLVDCDDPDCTFASTININSDYNGANVSCYGASDGEVEFVVTSSINYTPYTYLWDNAATTALISGLTAGTYRVTVTNANGCSVVDSILLTQPDTLLLQLDSTDVTCFGDADGSAQVSVLSGGTSPFTYLWSNGETTTTISALVGGTYTVTVTDINGCNAVDSTFVNEYPISISNTATNITCFGEMDGAVDLTVSGGTGSFSFLWSNGETTEDLAGLDAGTYYVSATDDSGCLALDTAIVLDATPISGTFVNTDVACNGDSTGSIELTTLNGTAPYTYLWSNGATVEDLVNIPAGNYAVTITDNLACTRVLRDTIYEPSPMGASPSVNDVSCYGGADGFVIETNATGGVPGYHYNWSDFEAEAIWTFEGTTDDITGNGHHRQALVGTESFVADTIERNTAFAFDGATKIRYSVDNDFMETAFTEKSVSLWVKPDMFSGRQTLVEEDGTFFGYTIRLNETDLEIGIRSAVSLWDFNAPFNTDGDWHHVAFTWDNGLMNVYLDGVLVITNTFAFSTMASSGGEGGLGGTFFQDAFGDNTDNFYQGRMDNVIYHNSALNQQQILDIMANDGTRSNLSADNYVVTITDANGCSIAENVPVAQPLPLSIVSDSTDISCFGLSDGSVDITMTGGITPYDYLWSNGATTQDITNVVAGEYVITVTDQNGCSIIDTTTINQAPLLSLTNTTTTNSCSGASDGTIDLTVTGGVLPYGFLWSEGSTTEDLTGLAPGDYYVTVTDANGCIGLDTATVLNAVIISGTCINTDVTCYGGNDGSIDMTISGGTAPYTFLWSNGETVEDVLNLAAGIYTVTVTDDLSCSIVHTDTINQPDSISINASLVNVSCFSGSDGAVIEVVTSGGTPGYHYNWNDMEATAIWTFENTADDISGNGNHPFAINGTEIYVSDTIERNNAFRFDGNTRIRYSDDPFMTTSFSERSISMWVKPDDPDDGEQVLFEEGYNQNGIALRFKDNNIEGGIASGNVRRSVSEPYPNDGDWHHVVLVYDNGELNLYLDGDLLGSNSTGLGAVNYPFASTGGMGGLYFNDAFGSTEFFGRDYYTGLIDDARYHNVALSEDQIEDMYSRSGSRHNLTASSYNLVVTDASSCTNVLVVNVTQPTELTMVKDSTVVSCFGGTDGDLSITVSGGVTPYSYLWNTGDTDSALSNLASGMYRVTVTDDNSCTLVDSINITQPDSIILSFTTIDVSCSGGSDGSIDLTVTNGQAPFSYTWDNGAGTNEDPTGLTSGTYNVTVTDNTGCTNVGTIDLIDPAGITVSHTITEISCNGGADGEIDISVSGGASPYTFNWDNGAGTDEDPIGLSANTYTVTVTDDNGCSTTETITVNDPSPANVTATISEVTCENGTDGTIDVSVSGGTPDYAYWWSDWDIEAFYPFDFHDRDTTGNEHHPTGYSQGTIYFSSDAINGDYSLYLDDYLIRLSETGAFMETSFTTRTYMMWVKPDNLTGREMLFEEGSDVHGMAVRLNNNILEAAVSRFSAIQYAGSHTFPNDGAWHHVAVVFDNGNLTLYLDGIAGTTTNTGFANIPTNGGDGGIGGSIFSNAFASSGNSFYHGSMDNLAYSNSALTPEQISDVFNNTGDRFNLTAGTYTVYVHDANGCITTADFDVTEIPPIVLSLDSTDVNCNAGTDGAIDLSVSGGTAPYAYLWSAGGQTTQDISSLTANTYSVTVTDANACTEIGTVTVNEPLVLSLAVDSTDILCNGTATGAVDLSVSGGTSPFTFLWSNGATTEDISGVVSGNYTVSVTDANSCFIEISTTINEPSALQAQLSVEDANCFGSDDGIMNVSASGGTPSYTYLWSNGVTTAMVDNLTPGAYTVTLSDDNGCTLVLNGNITEPTQLNITASTESVSCSSGNDGRITNVVATGGTTDYYYNWSDMEAEAIWSFEDSLFDVSGNQHGPRNVSGTISFSSDAAEGDYSVEFDGTSSGVRYSVNGGFMESTFTERTITMYLKPDDLISRQIIYDEGGSFYGLGIQLYNGDLIVGVAKDPANVVTHTTPFPTNGLWQHVAVTYDNGDVSLYINGTLISTVSTGLGTIFSAGDNGGLGRTYGDNVFEEPGNLYYDGLMDHVRFHDAVLNADQLSDLLVHDGTRNNLAAGNYDLIVSDQNGCSTSISLTVGGAAILTAGISTNDVSCFNGNDGTINLIPGGGSLPLSFLWSNGATTEDLNSLTQGTYSVTITDNNGCTLDTFAVISQPTALTISASVTSDYNGEDISCGGASDGNATATATGGSGSYLYAWGNGQIGANLVNVTAGTYVVTVTDGSGCSATTSVTLTEPTAVSLIAQVNSNYNGEDISCDNGADAVLEAIGAGGNGSFSYLWSTAQTTSVITGIAAGTYSVTATDDFGCTSSTTVTVTAPSSLSASINITSDYNGFPISCESGADGSLSSTTTGGTGVYSYEWTTGATTSSVSGLGAGTYILTVTDQNGCTVADTIALAAAGNINFTVVASDLTDCGVNNGQVSITATGGTGTFEYRVNGGAWQSSNLFSGLSPGTYDAYVRNTFGTCVSGPRTVVIDVPESPTINNIVKLNPTTGASFDGSLLVNATGNLTSLEYRIFVPGTGWTPWQASTLFESLAVGVYNVEVKYNGQNCIAATQAELVAGGGISGNGDGVNYCSDEINGAQFVEAYYIPGPEDQLLQSLRSIYTNNGPLFCGFTTRVPSDPVQSYVGIGVVEDGVIIYYDHWEDGYEVNLSFPVQSSTEIWGDNNPANGMPPGFTVDILSAADQIVLDNAVMSTTRQTVVDYDGGDKVASLGNIAMTRLAWASGSETLLAGALEVYPTTLWGTSYKIPVGENTDVNQMFEYTGAIIMAENDNTSVNIDADGNGSFELNIVLNQGQSHLIDGNLNSGGEISASQNVQVHLITGDECATFESRFFTLKPTVQWSNSYYTPVSTPSDPSLATPDHPTYVHLYNPNSSPITILWETSAGAQTSFTLGTTAATRTAWRLIPNGSGAHFYTTNGANFYAVATIDSDANSNSAYDWGFALIPERQLSSQITLVGFAPGMDPSGGGLCCTGSTWWIGNFSSESAGTGNVASNAVDGDVNTFWHTDFSGVPGYPHFIEVNLGFTNTFTGFRYTPRQDGSTGGTIQGYELYSWNGVGYDFITSGTWANNTLPKEVYFPAVSSSRIRLVATSEINGNNWASAAELEVLNPENSSPVWITADYPTGSTSSGPIDICIDYDGDGSGLGYDTQISLNPLEIVKLTDIIDNDNDQTGMRIWVCDGSDAIIAGAWGQDPTTASGSAPAIDLGTGLPNGIPFAATKCVDISRDFNLNGLFDECDEIIYTIVIRNTGALSLSTGAVRITDTLSNYITYIPGTTYSRTGGVSTLIPDNSTPNTPFPLDEGGTNYNSVIAPGDSVIISFEAVINDIASASFVNNEAIIFNANKELVPSVAFPVEDPESPALTGVPADATVSCDSVPNPPVINDVNCNLGSVNYPPNQAGDSRDMDGQVITTGATTTSFNITDGTIIRDFRIADFMFPRDATQNLPCGASTRAIHFSQRERESNSVYGSGTTSTVRMEFSQAVENLSFSINGLDENLFHLDAVEVRIFDASNAELDYDCGHYTYGSKVEQVGAKEFQALDNSFNYEIVDNSSADGDIRFTFYNLNIRRVEITYKNNWSTTSNSSGFTQTNFDDYMNANTNSEQEIGIGQICYCIPGTNEGTVFVTNDCANNTSIVYSQTRTDGSCPYNYTLTRTWVATDHCGNVTTESQVLTVQDIEAPVLSSYPTDLTVALDSVPPVPAITATDNCGIATVNFLADTTTNVCEITIRRTWSATDECSNTTVHTQNILINAVINSTALVTSNYNGQDISCNGASDGSAVVRYTGGQEPISFLWSTGSVDSTITNVAAGTYQVTVTDANGCQAVTTVDLLEPSIIDVNANVTSDYNGEQISCNGGSDGSAFVSAIGGTPPIQFNWSTGQTTQNIVSLSSGTYYVTATDANGCQQRDTITLADPPPFSSTPAVISNYNGADVSCTGATDASISPGVVGGIGTLSFLWNTGATTPVLSGVGAGTYTVTVTDANGCTVIGSTSASNPPPINLTLNVTSNYNGADISCTSASDGSVEVIASGGVGGFSYLWDTGSISTNVSGLNAGTYTVTVTDNNSCTAVGNITLNDPAPLIVDATITSSYLAGEISCFAASDGTASALASGGTGAVSYSWSNGQSGTDAINLSANTYVVIATDANACTATDTVTLDDPLPITISSVIGVDPSFCAASDGEITVVATGGANNFEYRLNTGPWQTDTTFTGLSSGIYNIFIRNIDGTCEVNPDSVILVDPIPSACPIVTDTDPLIVCSSDVSVPFSVTALLGADNYVWTVPSGTNISSGQGTNNLILDINGLAVGNYSICVETVSSCGVSPSCCYTFEVITCTEICDNGIDDDGDGLTDCNDPDCEPFVNIIEPGPACINETVSFEASDVGVGATYDWDFGASAVPSVATGIGPHDVVYYTCGTKMITVEANLNGCMAYDTMYLDITDTELPTFTVPASITIDCDDVYTDLSVTGDVIDENDNCSINLDATYTDDLTQLIGCNNTGTIERTWLVTDDCGNSSSGVQTITVQDTTPPAAFSGVPGDTTVNCNSIPVAPVIGTDITATDNCDPFINLILNETDNQTNNGTCTDNNYTITRIWIATDNCGNSSTISQVITVQDTIPPTAIAGIPSDTTVLCDAIPTPPTIGTDITSSDICDPSVDIVLSESDNRTNDGSCTDNNYTITRVWSATDNCGNVRLATQLITVIDTIPPTALIGIPNDTIVACDQVPSAPDISTISSTDNCDASLDISLVESSTQTNNQTCTDNNYVITRTWIAIDNCGNTATAQQTVTVIDDVSPVLFGIPNDSIVSCDSVPAAAIIGTDITATDNCTNAADISINLIETDSRTNTGACSDNNYSILRLWVATDLCGNTATAQQIIQVIDNSPPYFLLPLPTDTTVACDQVPILVDSVFALDNCADSTDVNIAFVETTDQTNIGSCTDNNYTITRTWTISDNCGNSNTHQQIITVIDTIAPFFTSTIPVDTLVSCDGIPSPPTITASDGCDSDTELSIVLTETSGQTNTGACSDNNYLITRVWTATDQCGNSTSAQQIITVFDNTAPIITVNARDTIVECDGLGNTAELAAWLASFGGAVAIDNCDPSVTWTDDYNNLGVPGLAPCNNDTSGVLSVTFTVTDNCGNTNNTTAQFIIIDTTDPVLQDLPDITVDCDDVPVPVTPTASDDCDPSLDITYQEVVVRHPNANWKNTGSCSLLHTVSAASYDDKGTATTSDDEMSFNITVIGQNTGTAWSAVVNGTTINGEFYKSYEFGPFLSNGSVLNFSISDDLDNTCTTPVTIDIADF